MTGVIRIASRIAAAGALALIAACGTMQPAAPPPPPANPAAEDFTCKRADAANVDLVALSAHPEQFAEKCVRTKAFSDATLLYADAGQMLKHKGMAVYWKDSDTARRLKLGPSFVIIVGRVRPCAGRALMPTCTGMAVFASLAEIIPTAMD